MEWSCRYLPWVLEKLSDDEYTKRIDELESLNITVQNLRKLVPARYFLHWAALANQGSHPRVVCEILDCLHNLSPKVPWNIDQMTTNELVDAYVELGELYC
jgi:hypothetical protein